MENENYCQCSKDEITAEAHKEEQCTWHFTDKDKEFRLMMIEDETRRQENKDLEVDDWSMYDGQYPRLGPMIFNSTEEAFKFA